MLPVPPLRAHIERRLSHLVRGSTATVHSHRAASHWARCMQEDPSARQWATFSSEESPTHRVRRQRPTLRTWTCEPGSLPWFTRKGNRCSRFHRWRTQLRDAKAIVSSSRSVASARVRIKKPALTRRRNVGIRVTSVAASSPSERTNITPPQSEACCLIVEIAEPVQDEKTLPRLAASVRPPRFSTATPQRGLSLGRHPA